MPIQHKAVWLPVLKEEARNRINGECRDQIIAGFESSALGEPHQYPFKGEDQSNLMSTFMLAKELNVDKPFKCWDAAGIVGYRIHTVAQLQQVGQDADNHKMIALIKAATLKARIEATANAAEVEAIIW